MPVQAARNRVTNVTCLTFGSSDRSRSRTRPGLSCSAGRSSARCWRCSCSSRAAVVAVDRLIDALWGEQPPRTAATSLQNFVSQLRKTLGPTCSRRSRPATAARPARASSTSTAFASRRERPRRRTRRRAPRSSGTRSRSGAARRSRTSPSRRSPSRRSRSLEELRLAALEERVEAELDAGRHAELVGELEALVERASASRAAARPTDARAVPLRAAGGGARRSTRTARRRRSSTSSGSSRAATCSSCTARSCARTPGCRHRTPRRAVRGSLRGGGRGAASPGGSCRCSAPTSPSCATRLARAVRVRRRTASALPRVAQYVAVMKGSGPLYDELHALLDADAAPTADPPLLRVAAAAPARARRAAPADRDDELRPRARARVPRRRRGVRRRLVHRRRPATAASSATSRPDGTGRADRSAEHVRDRALARASARSSSSSTARSTAAPRARVGELRRHRGRLHRLPRAVATSPAPSRSRWRRSCGAATSSSSATRWPTGTCA